MVSMGSEEEGLIMSVYGFLHRTLPRGMKSQMVELYHSALLIKSTKNWGKAVLDRCHIKFDGYEDKNMLLRLRNGDKISVKFNDLDAQRVAEIYGEKIYTPSSLLQYWHGSRVILDIGANKGIFSIYAASLFPNSIIYAYEPNPEIFSMLRENIQLNDLERRCILSNCAVWSKNELLPFTLGNPKNPGTGQIRIDGKALSHIKMVPGVAFTEILRACQEVDFLKMDIEGAEYEAILYTPYDELRRIKFMAMEYHGSQDHHVHDLTAYLKAAGFSVLRRSRGSILYAWRSLRT
jgi:FkbM family methyltransferase